MDGLVGGCFLCYYSFTLGGSMEDGLTDRLMNGLIKDLLVLELKCEGFPLSLVPL